MSAAQQDRRADTDVDDMSQPTLIALFRETLKVQSKTAEALAENTAATRDLSSKVGELLALQKAPPPPPPASGTERMLAIAARNAKNITIIILILALLILALWDRGARPEDFGVKKTTTTSTTATVPLGE